VQAVTRRDASPANEAIGFAGRPREAHLDCSRCPEAPDFLPWRTTMLTLSIRYTLDPNKLADFRTYVEAELPVIRRSGGEVVGYFLPTDFAGPTNDAVGLIDFADLASYEQYRRTLAADTEHKGNVARLERSSAVLVMNRAILQRAGRD
jgi:hypothetical protein